MMEASNTRLEQLFHQRMMGELDAMEMAEYRALATDPAFQPVMEKLIGALMSDWQGVQDQSGVRDQQVVQDQVVRDQVVQDQQAREGMSADALDAMINRIRDVAPPLASERVSPPVSDMGSPLASDMVPAVASEIVPTVDSKIVPTVASEIVPTVVSEIVPTVASEIVPAGRRIRLAQRVSWFRYAAAVLFVACALAIVAGVYFSRHNHSVPAPTIAGEQQEILPGSDKAVLTLADGSRIQLDEYADGSIAKQGNTQILKLASGRLEYTSRKDGQPIRKGETLYNSISTPKGGQYQVLLPDDTRVWLNAASSIRFPTSFSGDSRTVEISGEAYLEVSKNRDQPFRVISHGMEIAVLGTEFNINAYSDESSINTTLLKGSIVVSTQHRDPAHSVMLKPGQQAQIVRTDDQQLQQRPTVVSNVDLDKIVAWKNGRFNFNGADVYTVMQQLSRWYDLDIRFEGEVPKLKIKGEMGRDLNLSELLDLLREMGVRSRLEGKTLIVGK
jgi:transmembrane sensor